MLDPASVVRIAWNTAVINGLPVLREASGSALALVLSFENSIAYDTNIYLLNYSNNPSRSDSSSREWMSSLR